METEIKVQAEQEFDSEQSFESDEESSSLKELKAELEKNPNFIDQAVDDCLANLRPLKIKQIPKQKLDLPIEIWERYRPFFPEDFYDRINKYLGLNKGEIGCVETLFYAEKEAWSKSPVNLFKQFPYFLIGQEAAPEAYREVAFRPELQAGRENYCTFFQAIDKTGTHWSWEGKYLLLVPNNGKYPYEDLYTCYSYQTNLNHTNFHEKLINIADTLSRDDELLKQQLGAINYQEVELPRGYCPDSDYSFWILGKDNRVWIRKTSWKGVRNFVRDLVVQLTEQQAAELSLSKLISEILTDPDTLNRYLKGADFNELKQIGEVLKDSSYRKLKSDYPRSRLYQAALNRGAELICQWIMNEEVQCYQKLDKDIYPIPIQFAQKMVRGCCSICGGRNFPDGNPDYCRKARKIWTRSFGYGSRFDYTVLMFLGEIPEVACEDCVKQQLLKGTACEYYYY